MSLHPAQATTPYTMREAQGATRAEWDGWLEGSPGGELGPPPLPASLPFEPEPDPSETVELPS